MFTDRFIKLPTKIYSEKQKDLTGIENCVDVISHLIPFEIIEYLESFDDEDVTCIQIGLKSGRVFYAYLTLSEFEKLLNEHQR